MWKVFTCLVALAYVSTLFPELSATSVHGLRNLDSSTHKSMHTHFPQGRICGYSDPNMQKSLLKKAEKIPQKYHQKGRRLVDQQYEDDGSGGFLTITEAEAQDKVGNIRIKVLWDVVLNGDITADGGSTPQQCNTIGETIKVTGSSGGTVTWSGCATEHIANPDTSDASIQADAQARFDIMEERTNWAIDFWYQRMRIKPVQDPIVISNSILNNYQLSTSVQSHSDVDLVIIMTARPSPFQPIAGYASCLQRDQHNRCTVGNFNWVPEIFELDKEASTDMIRSERHTAVHELTHVFGGILPGYGDVVHIDDNGDPLSVSDVAIVEPDSSAYQKSAIKIKTPRVLQKARDHFKCQNLTGVAVEDVPLGKGAHWEARLLGPEYMSYGSQSGEVYVSDLTFAFLEDTNQYLLNYSLAGVLVEPEANDFSSGGFGFLQSGKKIETYDPPAPLPPGQLRWGRDEGCGFIENSAHEWSDRYFCKKYQEYGCTYDNRMSAVCVIKTDWTTPQQFSCGSAGATCSVSNDNCDGGTCHLPSMFQYFDQSELGSVFEGSSIDISSLNIGQIGGYSDSLDYVPVQTGFWNCQDQKAGTNGTSRSSSEGSGFDFGSLLSGTTEDMQLFGGQAHCPNCRCFTSSLLELSTFSFNPKFPRYGLCYRSNCYREDYLQIAIHNQLGGVSWYKCPADGGKLYIAGFTGAFHCPRATDFCRFETISGVKYPETNPLFEIIFFSVVGGIALVIMCTCCVPVWRDKLIRFFKFKCGVMHFDEFAPLYRMAGKLPSDELPSTRPADTPGVILLILNAVTFAAGACITGLTIYALYEGVLSAAAMPLLILGVFVTIGSVIGMVGARKPSQGPSCFSLTYFYTVLIIVLAMLWAISYILAFSGAWKEYVDRNFDIIADAFPDSYDHNAPRDTQVAQATQTLEDNMAIIAAMGVGVIVIYTACLLLAGRILRSRVVISTTYTVLNNACWVVGLIFIAIGAYLQVENGATADLQSIPVLILVIGLFLLVNGVVGLIGAFKKSTCMLSLSLLLSFIGIGFSVAAAVVALTQTDRIENKINSMDESELQRFSKELGYKAMSKEQIISAVKDNLRRLGLSAVLVGVCLIILFVCGIFFLRMSRRWVREHTGAEDEVTAAKRRRKQREQELYARTGRLTEEDLVNLEAKNRNRKRVSEVTAFDSRNPIGAPGRHQGFV